MSRQHPSTADSAPFDHEMRQWRDIDNHGPAPSAGGHAGMVCSAAKTIGNVPVDAAQEILAGQQVSQCAGSHMVAQKDPVGVSVGRSKLSPQPLAGKCNPYSLVPALANSCEA